MRLLLRGTGRGRRRGRKNKRRWRKAKRRRKGPGLEEQGEVEGEGRETREEKGKGEDSHGKRGNWSRSGQDLVPTPDSEPCLTKLLRGSTKQELIPVSALIRSGLLGVLVFWFPTLPRPEVSLLSGVISSYAQAGPMLWSPDMPDTGLIALVPSYL